MHFDFNKIKVASQAPSVVWMPPEGIEDRLDAYPNDVRFLTPLQRLIEWNLGRLTTINEIAKLVRCGPFGSNLLAGGYSQSGVCVIRPFNISNWSISTDGLAFLPEQECRARGLHLYNNNTLVFARVGNIAVGSIPHRPYKFTISPNIIAAEIKDSNNSYYLCAFLNSKYGVCQLERALKVVAQPTISTDTVRNLRIPIPDRRIQDYIGAKVELAERCRAEAATLQRQLAIRISELYKGAPSVAGDSLSTLATLDELENDRIDAWHYQRHFINLSKWLRENDYFTRLEKIGNLSRDRWNPTEHPDSTFTYIEISNVNTTTGQLSPNQIEVSKAPSRARKLLKAYDILVSTVRPNRGAISVVPDNLNGAVGSTGFAVVRTRNRNDAYFLSQILKHPISIAQLMRWNTGSAYPAIEEDVVLKVWVPGAKANVRNELGTLEWQRYRLQEEGARLISEAKSDIEALIEGILDTNAILSGKLKPPTWETINESLGSGTDE